jgi:hypothetical protein
VVTVVVTALIARDTLPTSITENKHHFIGEQMMHIISDNQYWLNLTCFMSPLLIFTLYVLQVPRSKP